MRLLVHGPRGRRGIGECGFSLVHPLPDDHVSLGEAGTMPHHASAYDYYGRISQCLPVFVLAQFALGIWYIISVVLASGSHCSGCLGVAYEYESWILREMTFLRGCNAWYNTGYMFCVSTLVTLEEFTHFLRGGRLVS